MAPWLLPSMRRRYRGPSSPISDLRVFDAREIPERLAAPHRCEHLRIGGAPATLIDPGSRHRGVIVFLHGGAYVFGPGPGHWDWLCAMCDATGMAGLMVLYDRAPEAPFPAALEQVVAACRTMAGEWVLAGDSAGGGLAVAAAMRLRDTGGTRPRGMVLSSPWLDLTLGNPEMLRHQQVDVMLGLDRLREYAHTYVGDHDARDPAVSPLHGDPAGLPPMLVTVGGAELMLWECREWAARCSAAGLECDLIEVPGAIHDFAMARTLWPEAREVFPAMAAFAQRKRPA